MAINRVTGLEEVLDNLHEHIAQIKGKTMAGLFEAGLKIERVSKQRTPVDTGNLKASTFTRKAPSGALNVQIGYTAAYAVFVHEDMEAAHAVGQPKFLESALNDNQANILEIIRRRASV